MNDLFISDKELLERVDEYALYCSYLGYEPVIGTRYTSPLRTVSGATFDDYPSFGIFERRYTGIGEFHWKDQGLGIHGDIFELVRRIYQFDTRTMAIHQIQIDAGLIPGNPRIRIQLDTREKQYIHVADIDIKSRDFTSRDLHFWDRINVQPKGLARFNVRSLSAYWLHKEQSVPYLNSGLGFAYPVWDKYQLYFPTKSKNEKFRTDWTEICVPGFSQLRYQSDTLVITKSMKDILCLDSFGYESIAPRGEHTMIPQQCLDVVVPRYKRVVILFDNDGKHNGHLYPYDKIYVPRIWEKDKDTSDFCSNHGPRETSEMLRQIIQV